MTKDEIIEMVMQIGGCDRPEDDSPALKMFVTFAKLVATKERERIISVNASEIERCNSYIKELEDKLARG